jgi:hypothetical protein
MSNSRYSIAFARVVGCIQDESDCLRTKSISEYHEQGRGYIRVHCGTIASAMMNYR